MVNYRNERSELQKQEIQGRVESNHELLVNAGKIFTNICPLLFIVY